MATLRPYEYSALNRADHDIRLLKVLSMDLNEDLEIAITHWPIDKAPGYVAVSYTWGMSHRERRLRIGHCVLGVRENCWYALNDLHRHQQDVYIWMDAVCVDQENVQEKGPQVAMMSRVFAEAAVVVISLGPMPPGNLHCRDMLAGVMGAIERMLEDAGGLESEAELLRFVEATPKANSPEATAMVELASMPYWTRLWTVQEIFVAAELSILYHDRLLRLHTVDRLARLMHLKRQQDAGILAPEVGETGVLIAVRSSRHRPKTQRFDNAVTGDKLDKIKLLHYFQEIWDSPMAQLLQTKFWGSPRNSADSQASLGRGRGPTMFLRIGQVLQQYGRWGCSDPKDRVYGTMSFTIQPPGFTLQPDYSKTCIELAVELIDIWHAQSNHTPLSFAKVLVSALEVVAGADLPHDNKNGSQTTVWKQSIYRVNVSDWCCIGSAGIKSDGHLRPTNGGVQGFDEPCRPFLCDDSMLSSILCQNAMPGDLVVTMEEPLRTKFTDRPQLALVLRRRSMHALSIIGLAILPPQQGLCSQELCECHGPRQYAGINIPEWEVRLTQRNLFGLACLSQFVDSCTMVADGRAAPYGGLLDKDMSGYFAESIVMHPDH